MVNNHGSRYYGKSVAGCGRVCRNGGCPGGVRQSRIFVCLDEYWRDVGVGIGEYRRCGDADHDSSVAGRRSLGQWCLRIGVCQFYISNRIPLPVCGLGGNMGLVVGSDKWRGDANDTPRMARCRNVGQREIPGGVCWNVRKYILFNRLWRIVGCIDRGRNTRMVVCVDIQEW